MMNDILKTPTAQRDTDWERKFLEAFKDTELSLKSDQPFMGPDGFSYMEVSTQDGENKVNFEDFISWCSHAGVGIVVNLKKNKTPDYVFNYGMLWNYLLRAAFINEYDRPSSPEENSQSLLVHKILEGYLPQFVRENIKEFLETHGIKDVKVGLVSRGDQSPYELLWYFSNNSDLEEKDRKVLLESISWFLPLDYKLAVAIEDDPNLHLEAL